ncbi:hypothetical protein N7495_007498 [Penicillium taxi]|uniref:uncharacterized protein n=1 Tax=Penicillium taxi TaxID=168475 RepID=UPI002544F13F|nr:uncharacterized protein N7495_007498 [Penicillium taxi]KAJ5887457.1 hypothetical protein N7495_007498 [Penicillium taxi]
MGIRSGAQDASVEPELSMPFAPFAPFLRTIGAYREDQDPQSRFSHHMNDRLTIPLVDSGGRS